MSKRKQLHLDKGGIIEVWGTGGMTSVFLPYISKNRGKSFKRIGGGHGQELIHSFSGKGAWIALLKSKFAQKNFTQSDRQRLRKRLNLKHKEREQ